MSESDPPDAERTLDYPDQIATRDVLGPRARAGRAADTSREALLAQLDRPTGETAVKIGRYQLLEMVGAGGVGMVWGAWDPELERRVALKLVRWTTSVSRERMLREGQVLARLSHPNIIPIFDVGEVSDQVFLIMEWIKGETLRAFAPANPHAILDVYRQAGEGLAAAHRAGVIHRDFKPDNAIRGDDGRVRVLDFGLAHEGDEDRATHGAGTPRYMPPEQASGEPVTSAADQYTFCLSLREAFDRAGSVPPWIEAIVERGTAENPAERFGSMDELLAALARDPARRRRRAALGVGLVGAAVAAFAFGRAASDGETIEPCSAGDLELGASWNPLVRERVVARLRAAGSQVDADRIAHDLDAYGESWLGEQRRTCLANVNGEVTTAIHEGRVTCLARARSQLAAVGELLAIVDAAGLAPALTAARSLPDPHGCADDLGTVVPPGLGTAERVRAAAPQVERALVLALANRTDALPAATAATREARATGYTPLIARALLVEGRAVVVREDDARAQFAEAIDLALQSFDDITAVEAYARWVYTLAIRGEPARDNWSTMIRIAERLGRRGRFGLALMYNNQGLASFVKQDRDGARVMFEKAVAAAGDATELELLAPKRMLAQLESDPTVALRRYRELHDKTVSALGPTHADSYFSRQFIALVTPDLKVARREIEAACEGLKRWEQLALFANCAYEAAWIADTAGDPDGAARWMQHVRTSVPELNEIAAAYIAIQSGAADRADHAARLRELVATLDGKVLYMWPYVNDALVLLARVGDPGAGEAALAVCEKGLGIVNYRRLVRARLVVAEALANTRRDEAAQLAREVLPWYRAAGEADVVARLERIATASTP